MKINSINFGMRFSPNTERLITAAKNDCITAKQETECQKCINFLERIYPEKILDIKTEFYNPKSFIQKLFGEKGYYDKAYIDGIPSGIAKIQYIPQKKVKTEGFKFIEGLALPYQDIDITYRKESNLERLIAISNTILITHFGDINHFPYTPTNKFLGKG